MLNRMDARATFTPYDTFEEAVKNDPSASRRILSLNGMWKFHWAGNPEGRPTGFEREGYDVSGWMRSPSPPNGSSTAMTTPNTPTSIIPGATRRISNPRSHRQSTIQSVLTCAPSRFRRIGREARVSALPRCGIRILRTAERGSGRLQRGHLHSCGVRSDPLWRKQLAVEVYR